MFDKPTENLFQNRPETAIIQSSETKDPDEGCIMYTVPSHLGMAKKSIGGTL